MIKDGFIPFGPYRTYYRIVGKPSDKVPLLLLHGGPGSTHNYFEALDELAERDQRQLIMYDQIGCGLSSMPDARSSPGLSGCNLAAGTKESAGTAASGSDPSVGPVLGRDAGNHVSL